VFLNHPPGRGGGGGGGGAAVTAPKSTVATEVPKRAAPKVQAAPQAAAVIADPPPHVGGYEATAATPVASGNLEELWARLVDAASRASPFVRQYLLEAHPVSFEKGVFTIGFDPEFDDHRGLVDSARNHTLLQTKLAELGHANSQIRFIRAEVPAERVRAAAPVAPPAAEPASVQNPVASPVAAAPSAPAPTRSAAPAREKGASIAFNKDDFKNDPLIQKALEVFKGTIVDVRA
jgi:DNA polymerase-3 subunit gamma/tau